MAISNRHPLYAARFEDWALVRDAYRGEGVVKRKGTLYLPPTSGMRADGMEPNQPGKQAYDAYVARAVFPDFVSEAVEAALGQMHSRPADIQLPSALEPMRERATVRGESLEHLLRRINEQQLVTGRIGLMLDLPSIPDPANPLPYIATYDAERIINWDDSTGDDSTLSRLNLVVLDESALERNAEFDWETVEKYRVLILGDPLLNESVGQNAIYRTGLFRENNGTFDPSQLIEPSIRGNKLTELPFVLINSKDIVADPDDPPLLGLARLCMAIYRGEADYRQNLFMQGQDTLVIVGDPNGDDSTRVGAGAVLRVPMGGDAKYIGVTSQGLSEQRQALENDRALAMQKSGQLLNNRTSEAESGDALRIRVAAQTASLTSIAMTSGAGLQALLRLAAQWVGADPEEVIVKPNLEFAANTMQPKSLVELMTAKTMGAPISRRSIHATMRDRGFTKMEYEQELEEIEEEQPLGGEGMGTDAGGDQNQDPNEDPEDGQEEQNSRPGQAQQE